MPFKGTLTKAHIVDAVIEANGFTRRKSVKTIETLLELLESTRESGEGVLISCFGGCCVKQKAELKKTTLKRRQK